MDNGYTVLYKQRSHPDTFSNKTKNEERIVHLNLNCQTGRMGKRDCIFYMFVYDVAGAGVKWNEMNGMS